MFHEFPACLVAAVPVVVLKSAVVDAVAALQGDQTANSRRSVRACLLPVLHLSCCRAGQDADASCLTCRKDDDNKIDEDTRGAVRIFCNELAAAINKYYAFGNCFVDDAQ